MPVEFVNEVEPMPDEARAKSAPRCGYCKRNNGTHSPRCKKREADEPVPDSEAAGWMRLRISEEIASQEAMAAELAERIKALRWLLGELGG